MQPLGEAAWQFLPKLNIELPYDPAIPFLGIYPREMKTYVHIKMYKWMFIAALFTIVEKWQQLKYPSTDRWVNKIWPIVQQNTIW